MLLPPVLLQLKTFCTSTDPWKPPSERNKCIVRFWWVDIHTGFESPVSDDGV